MYLSRDDFDEMDRIKRLNIINSISGIKPANLIGTKSDSGQTNLAIFSSVVHIGSNPPLIGLISRPSDEVRRDTYNNIIETGYFSINHVPESHIENAHYTSAKFEASESEFAKCGFTEQYAEDFYAPFVAESLVQIGLKLVQEMPIPLNGTVFLIGEIQHVFIPESIMEPDGQLDLEMAAGIGISGLNSYYCLHKLENFPYARVEELPSLHASEE